MRAALASLLALVALAAAGGAARSSEAAVATVRKGQRVQAQLRIVQPLFVYEEKGRPTKKDRRMLDRWNKGRA